MRFAVLLFLLSLAAPVASAQSASDLFQQAVVMERTQGDLLGAIALYERVVEGSADRSLAAQALVRIGQHYERLGRDGALDAYRRVVSDFGEQAEPVGIARERLAVLVTAGVPETPAVTRLVLDPEAPRGLHTMDFSADQSRAIMDGPGGQYVLEVSSGRQDPFDLPNGECWLSSARFSPKGDRIAFTCGDQPQVWLADEGLTEWRSVFSTESHFGERPEFRYQASVMQWTPDGESLLVAASAGPTHDTRFRYSSDEDVRHLVSVSLAAGTTPTVIDADYFNPDEEFGWTAHTCIASNGRYLLSDWDGYMVDDKGWQSFVRSIDLRTGERRDFIREPGISLTLASCDPQSNTVHLLEENSVSTMQLLSVDILPDGSASKSVRLQKLPADMTSGGPALSAIPRFRSRVLGRARAWRWEASVEADRSVSLIGAKDEADRFEVTVDWTPDGRYKLSNRWPHIALSDTQTGTEIRHPIDRAFGELRHVMNPVGLTPDGGQFIGSANWAYVPYERTWIRDSRTGIYVDSLNGITALALTPERDAVVFRDDRDGACLSTITLRERTVEPLLCLDGARETQTDTTSGRAAWRPSVAYSRTGAYLAVAYPSAEGGRLVRVLATDGTLDEVIESLSGAPGFGLTPDGFELTPDEKGAYLIGEGQIAYYEFETRTTKPLEMSIPEGWRFRGGLQLHPDGKSADVRLEGEQLPRQLEFLVINRPEEAVSSAGG